MSTIRDVARIAGVSTSTVSHVLNETRFVEPATRERVVAAITETRYRQDALARALRRSRTDTIGLVLSDVGQPAFAGMIHGVEQAAAELNLGLLLASSGENADRESNAVETLLHRRVDGLILARAVDSHDSLLAQLAQETQPTVLLDRLFPDVSLDQVGVNNRQAMRQLADHLLSLGHRQVALVAGDLRVPTLAERAEGFQDAFAGHEEAGLRKLSGTRDEDMRGQLGQLFANGGITAVVASSTPLASLALDAMIAAGLSTPSDLAFATFDGFDQHPMFTPGLTTIRQPASQMGSAAVRLLHARIEGDAGPPRRELLSASLELQASTEDAPRPRP